MRIRYKKRYGYWRNYLNIWICCDLLWDDINKMFVSSLGEGIPTMIINDPTCDKKFTRRIYTSGEADRMKVESCSTVYAKDVDEDVDEDILRLNREFITYMHELRAYLQDFEKVDPIKLPLIRISPPYFAEWEKISKL